MFFIQSMCTIDEALLGAQKNKMTQPGLVCIGTDYYLKLDHQLVNLSNASNIIDAVQVLFMSCYVFNVSFPNDIRSVFNYIEFVTGMTTEGTKSVPFRHIKDFCNDLKSVIDA